MQFVRILRCGIVDNGYGFRRVCVRAIHSFNLSIYRKTLDRKPPSAAAASTLAPGKPLAGGGFWGEGSSLSPGNRTLTFDLPIFKGRKFCPAQSARMLANRSGTPRRRRRLMQGVDAAGGTPRVGPEVGPEMGPTVAPGATRRMRPTTAEQ